MTLFSAQAQLAILSPARAAAPRVFRNLEIDSQRHDELLAEMQRLRGSVYLRDGAIQQDELTGDGRHKHAIDDMSWHVLALDMRGRVCGCLRYLEEKKATRFDELWINHSALAHCPVWGRKFRQAVEGEMARARQKRFSFGEVGGWAVAGCRRYTLDPLRMVLATCGLFRLLGGSTGVATATVRHGSAAILRRIGLAPLTIDGVELPAYYDPQYRCEMEALRFDSDFPHPKYAAAISALSAELESVPVISRENKVPEWRGVVQVLELPARTRPSVESLAPVAG
jgi:hypothetical protein